MKKAIFLDRDGVINKDFGYVHKVEDFVFIDGVFEALKEFEQMEYLLVILTNQSGIGRGYYSLDDFKKVTKFMLKELKEKGIKIEKVYFCPHKPEDNCYCRKPNPAMFFAAAKEFDIDLKNSWMIGDKESDIKAAKKAGVKNTLLLCKNCKTKTLKEAVKLIKTKTNFAIFNQK